MLFFLLFGCSDNPQKDPLHSQDQEDAGDQPAESLLSIEEKGVFTIVRLSGTPYEMGYQHGELLHDKLAEGVDFLNEDPQMSLMMVLAEHQGWTEYAREHSDPAYLEECQGLFDAAGDIGWTMEHCLVLNYGDVIIERMLHPPTDGAGCSQLIVQGDESLLHGRILDWDKLDFIIHNPTIFVRQPKDEIPHVVIGFPGNLTPYQGMNLSGVVLASNEATPGEVLTDVPDGVSHMQLQGRMLSTAESIQDVRDAILGATHSSTETIVASDGDQQQASIFEMSVFGVDERQWEGAPIFQTNHFVGENTADLDEEPASESSLKRFDRLEEILDGPDHIDLLQVRSFLQDRVDPWSGIESSIDTFDDDSSIATNGALFGLIFDPEKRHFYVASGEVPVPLQDWVGFSLYQLLGLDDPNPLHYEQLP